MVISSRLQNWKIETQICVFVALIFLLSIPLACIPMIYLGKNMLSQFTDDSYIIAQKTFLRETNIIGCGQQQVLYEFSTIARNTLYLMNKLLIATNQTVSQSQRLLITAYLEEYKNQNYSMISKSLPGASLDIYSTEFVNQAFQISTIIPLISFEEGIAQSIQLILRNNFLVFYPTNTLPQNYNLSQQIWYLQFMQGFQKIANSSIDTKLSFKSTGIETLQIGLKSFATSVPCFNSQGGFLGSLMYQTQTQIIKELVQKYRNTEYTQYIVLNTGLLLFAEVNNSNYLYFLNSSITGFDKWDWIDIITNNYTNSTCVSLKTMQLVCKYNSLYKQDSLIQSIYLPVEQLYIISVITQEYLSEKISQETNFVNHELNQLIYQQAVEQGGISIFIIIITIVTIKIIFKPLEHILEDVSYSIFCGRLDIFRRAKNNTNKEIKEAENCFQLLTLSYNKYKNHEKSKECILIEDRQQYLENVEDTSAVISYCHEQFQEISDEQRRLILFFNVLILQVK